MDAIGNIKIAPPAAHELVLDLLIADGGTLSAQALCRAAGLFDIGSTALRVALTRLAASRKIVRRGRGLYAIDPSAAALSRAVEDWQQRHLRTKPWQADWLAVHDSAVLRSDRITWRRHSLALALRGFAALRPTLHLRPDNLAGGVEEERAQLGALGMPAAALVFRLSGLDATGQRQAQSLWDVRRLKGEHDALCQALTRSERQLRLRQTEAGLRESLLLGRTVIAFLLRDPVLPPELMSPASRDGLVAAMTRYQGAALGLWRAFFAQPVR
jgi:phenylacetic acid degradation operon negative regulatory protein